MKMYRRVLASYLCVCLIPLLLSMFTIFKLERNVQDSIIQDQETIIRATQTDIDQRLNDALHAVEILSQDALIANLETNYTISGMELFDLCKIIDVLSTTTKQQSTYVNTFCYFFRSNYLVSDMCTYHPIVTDLFTYALRVDNAEFFSILGEGNVLDNIRTIYAKDGSGYILVLRNLYDSRYREKLACVGAVLQLDSGLLQMSNADSEVFVIDENEQLLFGGERARKACEQIVSAGMEDNQIQIDGDDYLYSIYPSEVSGIKYGYLTMRDTYYEGVRAIWRQMFLEIILYFAVGIVFSVLWSWRTWMPFKGVLPYIESPPEGNEKSSYHSMESFAHALKGFAEEKESLENRLQYTKERKRIGYIARYLTGLTEDSSYLSQYIEEGQLYRMMIFSIIHPEESEFFVNVPPEKYAETLETLFFAINNILEEIFFAKRGGVILEIDNCLVMLAQEPPEKEEIQQAVLTVRKALSLQVACYVSDPCLHITDAPSAWQWVNRAYCDDMFWQSERQPGVWMATELLQNWNYRSYGDFLDHQKKLEGYLSGENYGKARKCLEDMIQEDFSDRTLPFELIRHRYAGTAELLLVHLPEEKRDYAKGIPYHSTAKQMKQQLWGLFDQIQAAPDLKTAENNKNELWTQEVREYICENYRDPALNASMIADHFGMNLSTLSRRYKNSVGHGVLDEVHLVRLDAAKKLLEDGLSVRETAEQTGYVESRAMIRAFKRYEGVTPGQYKERE